jgi:hypothetical protein
MAKILLHTLIVLLVIGLVAGGIYLLVEKSGTSLSGNIQGGTSLVEGGTRPQFDGNSNQPAGGNQSQHDGGFGGERGGSSQGWGQLLLEAGKIAAITAGVVLLQTLIKWLKNRRKNTASTTA